MGLKVRLEYSLYILGLPVREKYSSTVRSLLTLKLAPILQRLAVRQSFRTILEVGHVHGQRLLRIVPTQPTLGYFLQSAHTQPGLPNRLRRLLPEQHPTNTLIVSSFGYRSVAQMLEAPTCVYGSNKVRNEFLKYIRYSTSS